MRIILKRTRGAWAGGLPVMLCLAMAIGGTACGGEQDGAAAVLLQEGLERAVWLAESEEATAADLLLALVAAADVSKVHCYEYQKSCSAYYSMVVLDNQKREPVHERGVFIKTYDSWKRPSPDPAPEKDPPSASGNGDCDCDDTRERGRCASAVHTLAVSAEGSTSPYQIIIESSRGSVP